MDEAGKQVLLTQDPHRADFSCVILDRALGFSNECDDGAGFGGPDQSLEDRHFSSGNGTEECIDGLALEDVQRSGEAFRCDNLRSVAAGSHELNKHRGVDRVTLNQQDPELGLGIRSDHIHGDASLHFWGAGRSSPSKRAQ